MFSHCACTTCNDVFGGSAGPKWSQNILTKGKFLHEIHHGSNNFLKLKLQLWPDGLKADQYICKFLVSHWLQETARSFRLNTHILYWNCCPCSYVMAFT